jgi:hypothetical protein
MTIVLTKQIMMIINVHVRFPKERYLSILYILFATKKDIYLMINNALEYVVRVHASEIYRVFVYGLTNAAEDLDHYFYI